MNNLFPTWQSHSIPSNLAVPRKFKFIHTILLVVIILILAGISWEVFQIHLMGEEKVLLSDRLTAQRNEAARIKSENTRLDNIQNQFDQFYPYLAHRNSISHLLYSISSSSVLQSNCYLSKLSIDTNKGGDLDISIGLVSQAPQLVTASQDMDNLRKNTADALNLVRENMIISDYRLQSYNATGEPITRTGDFGGFELSEQWQLSVKELTQAEIIRTYEILDTNYPIKLGGKKQ